MATITLDDVIFSDTGGYLDLVAKLADPAMLPVPAGYQIIGAATQSEHDQNNSAHSGTTSFPVDVTDQTVRLFTGTDSAVEGATHMHVSLGSATNAAIGQARMATGIADGDDPANTPSPYLHDVTLVESAGTASYIVQPGNPGSESSADSAGAVPSADMSDTAFAVRLPFDSDGKAIAVTQEPGDGSSHKVSQLYNSWDFSLAFGHEVLAIAAGEVVDIRVTVPDGDSRPCKSSTTRMNAGFAG